MAITTTNKQLDIQCDIQRTFNDNESSSDGESINENNYLLNKTGSNRTRQNRTRKKARFTVLCNSCNNICNKKYQNTTNTARINTILAAVLSTFAIVLLCSSQASALSWSEILFNPAGTDNGKEYVELTANPQIEYTTALTGCTIKDSASSDQLILLHEGTANPASPGFDTIMILENNSF